MTYPTTVELIVTAVTAGLGFIVGYLWQKGFFG